MTATTVSQAVAKQESGPAALVRQSRPWFATVVPSHIDAGAFVALAVAYLRKSPKLADAAARNPDSFMAGLSECARLGLVPGDTYHLVPFEDRRNGTVDITGIVDYTGEIELIYRAGAVASVKAEIVYAKDQFRFTTDMDRPEHAPNWFGDRGELIGAYAYAVMKDAATSKVVIYSKAEIDRVKAVSKTSGRSDSPWNQWYDRMALKTVIHRLEHFVPTSAEYRREQLRAAAEVSQQISSAPAAVLAQPVTSEPHDVVDAEIVDGTPDASPAAEQASPPPGAPPQSSAEPAGEAPGEMDYDSPGTVITPQLTAIWTILSSVYGFGSDEKDQARAVCAHIIGHELNSTKDMSKNGARHVLDTLSQWRAEADEQGIKPRDYLISVMAPIAGDGDE